MSVEQYEWVKAALIDLSEAVGNGFAAVDRRLERVEGRLDSVEGRLERVEGRLDSLERRVTTFEGRADEQFALINGRLLGLESPKHKRK